MTNVVSVRFKSGGKAYFFDPGKYEVKNGEFVIVETARGLEYGEVVTDVKEIEEDKIVSPLKPVVRIATEADTRRQVENKEKEHQAIKTCEEKIHKHKIDMKLVDVEYTFAMKRKCLGVSASAEDHFAAALFSVNFSLFR